MPPNRLLAELLVEPGCGSARHDTARAVILGIERSFGQPPVVLRTLGGTVPIAPFIDALGFPALLVPTVNFDNNQHEENENLRLGHVFQAAAPDTCVEGRSAIRGGHD